MTVVTEREVQSVGGKLLTITHACTVRANTVSEAIEAAHVLGFSGTLIEVIREPDSQIEEAMREK